MKAYKVTLEFTVSIVDVEKQRRQEEQERKRAEAVEVHQKLMATKAAKQRETERQNAEQQAKEIPE